MYFLFTATPCLRTKRNDWFWQYPAAATHKPADEDEPRQPIKAVQRHAVTICPSWFIRSASLCDLENINLGWRVPYVYGLNLSLTTYSLNSYASPKYLWRNHQTLLLTSFARPKLDLFSLRRQWSFSPRILIDVSLKSWQRTCSVVKKLDNGEERDGKPVLYSQQKAQLTTTVAESAVVVFAHFGSY